MNKPIDISGITLKTKRLILRPWQETDLYDLYAYAKVDGVGQMAGWMPHKSIETSQMILESFIRHKKTFAIVYGSKVIGSLGVETYREENYPELAPLQGREIGYVLSKDHWGQGLMPEAVNAVVAYLLEEENLDFILVGHFTWNRQSARVIEKCGFEYVKTVDYTTQFGKAERSREYILYNAKHNSDTFRKEDNMDIAIKKTDASEAALLSQIQKAAFLPLYEKYHDEGSPYLRGPEDILQRLNKSYRHFTILYGGKTVGGIFYRLYGKRSPVDRIAEGEYYLCRVYVDPDYQGKGIACSAILLCENEFPDAKVYYVDFPTDMEKNRRCYEKAGYLDSGERLEVEEGLTLAFYKKHVYKPSAAKNVRHPMVYEIQKEELPECLTVIHDSFRTVAEEFGLTPENCPKHTSFLPLTFLETQMKWGWHMFALYAGKRIIGYMSLSKSSECEYELHNLAVLPAYRHSGFGRQLLDHAKETVKALGGTTIKIGIIEESTVLKNWYIANGFVHTGTKKFDHLPFTSGYLEWKRKE